MRSIESLVDLLQYYAPDEEVDVTIETIDGDGYKEKTVTVTLGEDTSKKDSKDSKDSQDSQDSSDEESQDDGDNGDSLLQEWENSLKDGTGYERYYSYMW